MKIARDLSIQNSIIITITLIIAVSIGVSAFLVFNVITSTTKDLINEQASEINKQIVLNYENYTKGVTSITNLLQKDLVVYDVEEDKNKLLEQFANLEEIDDGIGAISLFDNSGELVVSTRNLALESKEIGIKDWFKKAVFDETIIHFSSPHEQDIYEVNLGEVISVSRILDYHKNGISKQGILLIDMNFVGLDALSSITNLGEKGHIIILDADDSIVYSSDPNKYNEESSSYDLIKDTIFGSANAIIDGQSMAVNINTISSTRWRIATFQNINNMDEGMNRALFLIIGLVTISLIITLLVSYYLATRITHPLTMLDRGIIKFQNGVYDSKVEVQGQKEVKIVTQGFNDMIDKIHELMAEVIKEQEGKRQTEISVLQNQINPHFLYNTLDCIIWLAEQNRNEDLVNTVGALSTFFRVSLSKGKQFIPIAEELQHIKSYVLIQNMRYNNCFTYSVEYDETIIDLKIMKLLLQPLVENAIYHGIDKDDEDSFIKTVVKEQEGYVILSVINSGYGISDKKIKEIHNVMEIGNEKGSVGMKNVYRRIKLFYGTEANLHIESELDVSTTISIRIPKDKIKEQKS